jgi:hypothetical protein
MLIGVRLQKEVIQVSILHNQTILDLKREISMMKNIPDPFPYWLTYHGLVLLDDMMVSEIGFLEGTELLCAESLTSSIVIPTAKGNEVWRVNLQPSMIPGSAAGQVLINPSTASRSGKVSPGLVSTLNRGWLTTITAGIFTLDLNTILSCAGMMWSFWTLSNTISRELNSFKENKTFSDIARSMVNGSIEGMLENMTTIKKLFLSAKLN